MALSGYLERPAPGTSDSQAADDRDAHRDQLLTGGGTQAAARQ